MYYYTDLVEKLTERVIDWYLANPPEWQQFMLDDELHAINAVNEICLDYLEDNYLHMGTAKRLNITSKVKKNFFHFLASLK